MTTPPPVPERELLATRSGVSTVTRVYRAHDALEVDEFEGIDVGRRRILLDEVLMVTRHRERGVAFVIITAALAVVFTGIAALVSLGGDRTASLIVFAVFGLPFLVALIWRLAFGVDVVTVFGKRSKVALRFSPVAGRAPVVYGRLCRLVRNAQRTTAPPRAAPDASVPGAGPTSGGGATAGGGD